MFQSVIQFPRLECIPSRRFEWSFSRSATKWETYTADAVPPNRMKVRGERQDPLRLRQATREDSLEDDTTDQADQPVCLSYAGEQFRTIVVRCRPGTVILGTQEGRRGYAGQAGRKNQARVHVAKQQKPGD